MKVSQSVEETANNIRLRLFFDSFSNDLAVNIFSLDCQVIFFVYVEVAGS